MELIMPSLTMNGPYDLDIRTINDIVTKKFPGNYALGHPKKDGAFVVKYIGRSDSDINAELKRCISRFGRAFTLFKYSYAPTRRAAFEKECQNFHDFGGSDKLVNENHPSRTAGVNWKCPECRIFG